MKESTPNGDRAKSRTPNSPLPCFIANHAALDFINSTTATPERVIDCLRSGKELLDWLVEANLICTCQAGLVRANSAPGELDKVAARARALRKWFRRFVISHMGRRLSAEALHSLQPLNRVLQRDRKYWAIMERTEGSKKGPQPSGLERRALRRCCTANALVLPIAQAMADLVCLEDFSQVKTCDGKHGAFFFLDRSQSPRRDLIE